MPRSCKLVPADPARTHAHASDAGRPRVDAVTDGRARGRRIARAVVRRGPWVLALAALIAGGSSHEAQALPPIPNPLAPIGEALGAGAANAAVDAFDAIIAHLFAPVARFVNVELLAWLVSVPNFSGGNVRELETTVCAMGAAALGAVATVAVARYWLAGLAGGATSGFEALEGLARTIGAALFLPLWPWLFDTGVALSNLFTSSLMGSGSVSDDSARLLVVGLGAAGALSATGVGEFLMLVVAVVASLEFLALLLLKLVLSVSTVLVFVAMPAAAVLWPIPACEWLARLCARAYAVCLLVPACWALCFAAAAAVGVDALGFKGSRSGALDALLEPLVAIMLLFVALALPRSLARVAMLGGGALGGGTVSRAGSYAAGRTLYGAAAQHLPNGAGGHSDAAESSSGSSSRAATAAVAAGAVTVATGGPAAPAAAAAGSGATNAGAGGSTAIGGTASGA